MFRLGARSGLRFATRSPPSFTPVKSTLGKRFASTSPANARRSWKSSALRWGIAIGGLYYYNTSPVFAEQPQHNLLNPNLDAFEDERRDHSTLEALTSGRSRQAEKNAQVLHSAADSLSSENASQTVVAEHDSPMNTGAGELEAEAANEGAFNPETGEINWDCPCLGGMAHGPCGEEFRAAFSCFVFSEEEPKGMDCIDKFQNMQQCFQKYPEVYKGELEDDEELSAGMEEERQELVNEIAERKKQQSESGTQRRLLEEPDVAPRPTRAPKNATSQEPSPQTQSHPEAGKEAKPPSSHSQTQPESLPKATFDATAPSRQGNQHSKEESKKESSGERKKESTGESKKESSGEGNKQPSEEKKVKVSDDKTHEEIFSPERENITEGQKSGVTSEPKKNSPPSGDQPPDPQPDIVPRAAFSATDSVGVPKPKEEGK